MLNTTSEGAVREHNASLAAPVDIRWQDLDVPHRIARVIERRRFLLDGNVTERDFEQEVETCDLDVEVIRKHIGAAKQIVEDGEPHEPTYDRDLRLQQGTKAVMSLLPDREAIMTCLDQHHFSREEANDLAADIVEAAATSWRESGATPIQMDPWARRFLETYAE